MRRKRLARNTIASLVFQITTIICGFILPRLILRHFGSEINGLVNSITQFLGVIAFLELGVGAVVQSTLYKPLAEKDYGNVSKVISSANNFFRRLAIILLCYVCILIVAYPHLSNSNFGWLYSGTLIAAMSISSFAQYYFGVVDRLLLTADQKGYIQYTAQTITLVGNTFACAILINHGASIQFVKLTTSLIYLIRPIYLRWYVNNHYIIDRKVRYTKDPIEQKWNGVAQHVASVVLEHTDTIVLTLFSTLSNVSIYAVYHLVVNGIKSLFTSTAVGVQALFGELWAKQELDELRRTFAWVEWVIHTSATLVFGCAASAVVAFVQVYTSGVNDANYIVPVFALLITLANALHCLRIPYNIMILAGGHYKQTQHNYIIAAVLNIVISVITVKMMGLVGVAIGTLVAMAYQTVWMAIYDSNNFLSRRFSYFLKHIIVDAVIFMCAYFVAKFAHMTEISYGSWIVYAVKCSVIWVIISMIVNIIFYREFMLKFCKTIGKQIKRRK